MFSLFAFRSIKANSYWETTVFGRRKLLAIVRKMVGLGVALQIGLLGTNVAKDDLFSAKRAPPARHLPRNKAVGRAADFGIKSKDAK
jgi:hypothetical protein